MALFGFKDKSNKFFDKNISPSCSYCEFGRRTSDGMKILCSKKGPMELSASCSSFKYSPLKRVPVKQLHIPGNFEDVEAEEVAE